MKTSHLVLGVGLAGAAAVAIFGDRSNSAETAAAVEPAARHAPAPRPASASASEDKAVAAVTEPAPRPQDGAADAKKAKAPVMIAELRPRAELMKQATAQIFGSQTFDAPPPPPPPPPPPAPPAPPVAPPLPFTYLGKKLDNQKWEVWLALGDQTLYVRDGSVIERDYVVNAIKPPTLTLTYLPLKQMQTMTIGGAE